MSLILFLQPHWERKEFRTGAVALGLLLLVGLSVPRLDGAQRQSAFELVEGFKTTRVFWQQFEIARKIAELRDPSVLPELESFLLEDDRHLRGNAAFVFAGLGDRRGFDVITAILGDHRNRREGQGIPAGRWSLEGQVGADRYYAVHLLGELKDVRAVSILVPLLKDDRVNDKVAWALGEIGGEPAVRGLIDALRVTSADVRVIAIEAIGKLNAKEALPSLRPLLDDREKSHFGQQVSVAEAARAVITKLGATR